MTVLTQRFVDAVNYARIAHAAQIRKGSGIPYIYHLLAVSSLVLEHGGNEDQAIAGLLHDVLEDCGGAHIKTIQAQFGDDVARIVEACTDEVSESKDVGTDPEAKRAEWRRRKIQYLEHLEAEPVDALLVSACDKLHNASAILADLENPDVGMAVFERFTAGLDGTLAYYHSLAEVFARREAAPARRLQGTVDRIFDLVEELEDSSRPRVGLLTSRSRFRIRVYSNFHYMDEEEAYDLGTFDSAEDAIAKARSIVRESVVEHSTDCKSVDEVIENYKRFGDDPVVLGDTIVKFSAWDYAEQFARTGQ